MAFWDWPHEWILRDWSRQDYCTVRNIGQSTCTGLHTVLTQQSWWEMLDSKTGNIRKREWLQSVTDFSSCKETSAYEASACKAPSQPVNRTLFCELSSPIPVCLSSPAVVVQLSSGIINEADTSTLIHTLGINLWLLWPWPLSPSLCAPWMLSMII